MWALGILLYTLIYKENPFYNVDEILDHELRVPWSMSEGSIALIRAMLDRDVDRRLSIDQVMQHRWCTGRKQEKRRTTKNKGKSDSKGKGKKARDSLGQATAEEEEEDYDDGEQEDEGEFSDEGSEEDD